MFAIYITITCMLILALSLLAIPFVKHKALLSREFFLTALLTLTIALTLYYANNNNAALKNWLGSGKEHYELLVKFKDLGGVPGMITRIQQKLDAEPADPQGWLILGKLYLTQADYPAAQNAFAKALALDPGNEQIIFYARMANQKR